MEIQTQGSQTFNVPNNEEGRTFLKLMEKFRNKGWHYRIRGRGTRKYHGAQAHIPKQYSEWMAVYLKPENPKTAFAAYHNIKFGDGGETYCGCDPAAGFKCVNHQAAPRYGFYDYDLP